MIIRTTMVRSISRKLPDRDEVRTISPLASPHTATTVSPCPRTLPSLTAALSPRHTATGASGVTGVGEGAEFTFFQGVRVLRLGP